MESLWPVLEALGVASADGVVKTLTLAVPLIATLWYWSNRSLFSVPWQTAHPSGYCERYDPRHYSEEVRGSELVVENGNALENVPSAEHDLAYPHRRFAPTIKSHAELLAASRAHYEMMNSRRSCRFFSTAPVPREVIDNIVLTAGTAPSGAHMQPWTFVVVSDPGVKRAIREAAEAEERTNYDSRMSEEWKRDLAPLGTDWQKPFLELAPYLIVVFKQTYGARPDGTRATHYYFEKSVGIATGMLIGAIHAAGLTTLTHTPTPMGFLSFILQRPPNEKPYLLLPVGYPAEAATVPDLKRKALSEIMTVV
ncbi:iodotyrosine dehalogenase 1 [Thecamonas trahens ATCC 50062]|uniref:Iodotyrosine dehalogenase 1 n=1 Tax=Thecamonas trahens ATCC 50062 TaxID=461836 RepID=A0A0L0DKV1_THETB|nr:iodotyrosine dehalogenase 1 [Thecamonas trahens ATCC 50062]KNC52860.1 iodotyrosine dehalogenase 1 [Thecamonas trahens ATCC 50062]|eukprot:XP_013754961.1 iodotyrosine dehalogenase 1 [Thecamonas trahens ATCC 50062]